MQAWLLWTQRNSVIHGGHIQDPIRLAKRSADFLEEFRQTRDHLAIPTSVGGCNRWNPPPGASFKINFDAAIFQDINATGFGAIIRNGLGEVMASISAKGPLAFDSEEVEVLACRKALEFAADAGFSNLVIEGDNATVMTFVSNSRAAQSRLGHLYADIQCMVAGLHVFSVNCVPCSANSVAHSLACFARCITDEVVWLEESPPPTLEALYFDSH